MAENWNMQKIKDLTAIPESNTRQFEPQSLFINQKIRLQESFSVQTHRSDALKWPPKTLYKGNDPNG